MRGTLTDTGAIYGLIDEDADGHERAKDGLKAIVLPMLTTWPCLTETLYFLLKRIPEWDKGAGSLFEMLTRGDLIALDPQHYPVGETAPILQKYRDIPMDFADASLVLAAIHLEKRDIFTIDSDFHIYRLDRRRGFNVIP